jgi:hypothetical protein
MFTVKDPGQADDCEVFPNDLSALIFPSEYVALVVADWPKVRLLNAKNSARIKIV